MKGIKYVCGGTLVFLFVILSLPLAFGQSISSLTLTGPSVYNRFLVADLGLTGGGRNNRIFQISFSTNAAVASYSLSIEVRRSLDNKLLLSGTTDSKPYNTFFSGRTYDNYELYDAFGGKFELSDDAQKLKDTVLATGVFPEGSYRIVITLVGSNTAQVTVSIVPPYIQPIYPVDTTVTRSMMNFIYRTNLKENLELRLYSDPRGRNEIKAGGRLPVRSAGQRVNGARFASLLNPGELYYWQVYGDMVTSHGTVRVSGPLSMFLFLEEGATIEDLGLSEAEKAEILGELIEILKSLVNKRAAKSIMGYDLERVLLDNEIVTVKEILAILALIRSGDVQVNSIYFR